ncbi:lipopolysaccharide biosynthesis protein [Maribacter sp. BPC-D8]|uniref:lipopolysaccharide biosynthesis protein n=1 Tax=Maribacter sp. BPC-D8 TaxID=3053613 RepID=UPI002B45FA08|nr:lipopolysaccharide biosynthesis protein [Maribacter sp. BPC-D8]WRI28348.1 lipopolysaccharide biosynthesis protein [Maribacter sp. BPC-D8]
MEKSKSSLFSRFGINSDRTKNIVKHMGWSTLYKVGGIVSGFLIVPLTMNYLDKENYGVWLTLSSFVIWFSFFDIGLGSGLRNKFAEAKAKGDLELAKTYVSCAYFTIGFISLCLIVLFIICNFFIKWSTVFNTTTELDDDLSILMPVVFVFFGLQLVVKLINTIYAADQHHSIYHKIEFATKVLSLLMVWVLLNFQPGSLLLYGVIFSAIPVLILLTLNFISFSSTYNKYKPSYKYFKLEYLKEITGIGLNFFIIQIAFMVLMSTDNFVITQIFGPEEVVPYSIAQKYFSILFVAHTVLVSPYWSSITEAYVNNDIKWIRNSVKNVQRIWLMFPVLMLIMVLLSNWFYKIWVGDEVVVPIELSCSMALFVLLLTYQSIYIQFLNGTGKIRLQTYISFVTMTLNIPLSIFLAKTLNFGLSGVVLASCVMLTIPLIFYQIQYEKIILNRAKGIWNQ